MILRTFRNLFICGVSILGISRLYRRHIVAQGPLTRVLVFHDVSDSEWFEKTIAFLHEQYHIVRPEDFFASRLEAGRINVLLTFDDGYASWVSTCQPILERFNCRGLFFINSGLLDARDTTEEKDSYVRDRLQLTRPREALSWAGARSLAEAGHSIGGHTTSHARLSRVSDEVVLEEIRDDKLRIEEMIDRKVYAFAYPFGGSGDYSENTEDFVKMAGYTSAFTTAPRFATFTDMYQIPRLCVEDNLSPASLKTWVEGAYDIFARIKNMVKE